MDAVYIDLALFCKLMRIFWVICAYLSTYLSRYRILLMIKIKLL